MNRYAQRGLGSLGEKLVEAMRRSGADAAQAIPERTVAEAQERLPPAANAPPPVVSVQPKQPQAPQNAKKRKCKKACVTQPNGGSAASVRTARMIRGAPRLSAAAAEAALAEDAARRAPVSSPQSQSAPTTDTRALLNARLKGLADAFGRRECSAAAATVRITSEARETLRRMIASGASSAPGAQINAVVDVVLGVDFGSTTTKLVARAPYLPGEPAFAIPVRDFAQVDGHPHLWASRLWEGPDGALSLAPDPGGAPICAIKTRLMQDGDEASQADAAAFLAQILAVARGWVMTERADITRRGTLRWSYNFGFPAQSLDEKALAARYRRVIAAALAMSECSEQPTRASAVATLRQCEGNVDARINEAAATLQPEVAAAMAGVAKFSRLDDGLFALVDIGGGTTDIGAFNLFRTSDGRRMPIFNASVEMLGAEPARLCDDDPALYEAFKEALMMQARAVIWGARQKYPMSPRWTDLLPVFFISGGLAHRQHQRLSERIGPWLTQNLPGSRGARVVNKPDFGGVEHRSGADGAHRLCVAAGLSLPEDEIPEVIPPRAIDAPAQQIHLQAEMIGPEQV